jgi:hypothetical protein
MAPRDIISENNTSKWPNQEIFLTVISIKNTKKPFFFPNRNLPRNTHTSQSSTLKDKWGLWLNFISCRDKKVKRIKKMKPWQQTIGITNPAKSLPCSTRPTTALTQLHFTRCCHNTTGIQ